MKIVPPGDTIREVLEEHAMSQTELAKKMGYSLKHVNQVVRGHKPLSYEFALRLEDVFNIPAAVWLGLEEQYQLGKRRLGR